MIPQAIIELPTIWQRFMETTRSHAAKKLASRLVRSWPDLVIANNGVSAAELREVRVPHEVEPNVVVEPSAAGLELSEDQLVMSGLLIERKRPWLAVQALADKSLRDYRMVIVGDGHLRSELENLVADLRLQHRVQFMGACSRSRNLEALEASRLLVHPSGREGSPWVVGEAAAVGTASVVFRGTGADTTAAFSSNGSVLCPQRSGQLVEALRAGLIESLKRPKPRPSGRWSAARLPSLLNRWWERCHENAV
jgi:glycosyltransferase involved in cell wall biosynthesis